MSTYSDANLILPVAPYTKVGKIYSLKPTDGTGDFTFSRNSGNAPYFDEDGVMQYAAVNEPRYTFLDGATCPVLLKEQQVTNYCEWSNEISNWGLLSIGTGVDPVVTDNYATSPDGTLNASRVQFNKGVGTGVSYITLDYSSVSGTEYLDSFYVKSLSGSGNLELSIEGEPTGRTVGFTNVWSRVEVDSVVSGSTATKQIRIGLDSNTTGETADVLIWGVNIQNVKVNTSHIPTNGATATRLKDEVTDGGDVNTFNSEEGVLFINSKSDEQALTSNRFISLSDGTTNNRLAIYYSGSSGGSIRVDITVSSVNIVSFTYPTTITVFNKIALKWKANDFSLWVNGVEVATQLTGISFPANTFDRLNFDYGQGSLPFYAETKELMTFNESLTDEKLQELTS